MTDTPDKHSAAWIIEKVALEDELGPIVPGGAQGGVIARARRAALGNQKRTAVQRARERVRYAFQPLRVDEAA